MFGIERGEVHRFSAEAIAPSEVALVRRSALERAAERDAAARKLWALTSHELEDSQDHMLMGRKNAAERVGSFLLAGPARARGVVEPPMSRGDIADHLGLDAGDSPRTLARWFATRRLACRAPVAWCCATPKPCSPPDETVAPGIRLDAPATRRPQVTYATIMADMDLDGHDQGLLAVVGDLAERCHARVVGIAARQPVEMMLGAGRMTGELIELDRREIDKTFSDAEARFRAAITNRTVAVEWRSATTYGQLADYLADEARCADLIVTLPDAGMGFANGAVRVSIGDLIMSAGRPVLIVPPAAATLDLDHVVVASARPAGRSRRAVSDALLLLELAGEVTVVIEVADGDHLDEAEARLRDVVEWLCSHGVAAKAEPIAQSSIAVVRLEDVAHRKRAGLMVAGAYGHARLRECGSWAV